MDCFQLIYSVVLFTSFSDVSPFTLNAYQTGDKALLGSNPFTLSCTYTTVSNEVLLYLRLWRKRETDPDFKQIVNFQNPSLPFNATYNPETNLESRTVAITPTEDSKAASLVFSEIECDDKAIYRWIAAYTDGTEKTEQRETSFVVKANTLFGQDGRINYSPNANIEEGDKVTFSCSGDVGNEPVGHLGWFYYLNNDTLTPVNASSLAQTVAPVYQQDTCSYKRTSTLELTMTKDFHNILVRCTVQQDKFGQNGDDRAQTNNIPVYYSPKVTSIGNKNVDEGTQFLNLMCIADAYPEPMYSWVLPDGTVSVGSSYTVTYLQLGDKGTYTCVVYNTFKNVNHTVNETVYIDVRRTTTSAPHSSTTTFLVTSTDKEIITSNDKSDNETTIIIAVCVVAGLLILIVGLLIGIIVTLYKKRWNKPEEFEGRATTSAPHFATTNVLVGSTDKEITTSNVQPTTSRSCEELSASLDNSGLRPSIYESLHRSSEQAKKDGELYTSLQLDSESQRGPTNRKSKPYANIVNSRF